MWPIRAVEGTVAGCDIGSNCNCVSPMPNNKYTNSFTTNDKESIIVIKSIHL
jgi:hypothetical protein